MLSVVRQCLNNHGFKSESELVTHVLTSMIYLCCVVYPKIAAAKGSHDIKKHEEDRLSIIIIIIISFGRAIYIVPLTATT